MSPDGLQATRTALAWRRTVASAAAAAALGVHHALVHTRGWPAALLLIGVGASTAGIALAAGLRRREAHLTPALSWLTAGAVALAATLGLAAR